MSCVKLADDFDRTCHEGSSILTYFTSFFFDVPESIALPLVPKETKKKESRPLPPSIRVVKSDSKAYPAYMQNCVMGSCDIVYWVEARISATRRPICNISREIIVMPVSDMPPPLDYVALGKEYQLSAMSATGPFWRRKKDATLSVCSREPQPLVFGHRKDNMVDTELFLNFSRSLLKMNNVDCLHQLTHCEIVITLVATTYFVGYEEERILSLAEAKDSPLVAWKKTQYKMPKRRLKLANWKKVKGGTGTAAIHLNASRN